MGTVCGKPQFGVQHLNGHDQLNALVIYTGEWKS